MSIERILATSSRLDTVDLDWEAGRRAGLTSGEQLVLTYFADIESQTIHYLRDLLGSGLARDPAAVGFLSAWNYEEYFHGEALARLLRECGHPLAENRIDDVRRRAGLLEIAQGVLTATVSRFFPEAFPALYLAWGASQELTTLRGYEALERSTKNPVLAELCRRIARQERRHFAWYFNSAKERLAISPAARRLSRMAFSTLWAPVGVAEKGDGAFLEVVGALFGEGRATAVAKEVEERLATLPGLEGAHFFSRWLLRASRDRSGAPPLEHTGGALLPS